MQPGNDASSQGHVLDSFAVLAFVQDEAGSERVAQLLEAAAASRDVLLLSVINLGEVLYIIEREKGVQAAQQLLTQLEELPITFVDVDRSLALAAAHLKAQLPMAYADCFALALAQDRRLPLVTGDPEFEKAQGVVAIEWLPKMS